MGDYGDYGALVILAGWLAGWLALSSISLRLPPPSFYPGLSPLRELFPFFRSSHRAFQTSLASAVDPHHRTPVHLRLRLRYKGVPVYEQMHLPRLLIL